MGLKPGVMLGSIKQQAYKRQLDGEITTLDEALEDGGRLEEVYATMVYAAYFAKLLCGAAHAPNCMSESEFATAGFSGKETVPSHMPPRYRVSCT
jgi:hypothetical protein